MMPVASGTKRLVLATADVRTFAVLRGPLIAEAIRRRHKVVVLAADRDAAAMALLEKLGAATVVVAFEARGFNPFAKLALKREHTGHLKAFAPHAIGYCDAMALMTLDGAAKRAGVGRRVAMLPRLPLTGDSVSGSDKALRDQLAGMDAVVVETPEERRALAGADWLDDPRPRVFVAPSAGIDVSVHRQIPLPPLQDGFVFALVTPPGDDNARDVFLAAAERLKARAPQARFVVTDDRNNTEGPSAAIRSAHAVVHASSQDGLSSGLLHGLCAGRPVITTDVAASRDTVDERVNGCRVPPGDAIALAEAMASFLKRTDLVPAMARASRLKAERRYDLGEVNRITLEALGLSDAFAVAA